MVKVQTIGDKISVKNPANGEWTDMVVVTFIEEGRSGANASMSDTSDFLSQVFGEISGLTQVRVHTHPILPHIAARLKVGDEIPGHINRKMFSTPQLRQQEGVDARMVDGRPTYFTTTIENEAKEDVDLRIDLNVVAANNPNSVFNARVGATEVRRTKPANVQTSNIDTAIANA